MNLKRLLRVLGARRRKERVKHERELTLAARKLRDRQRRVLVALGAKAAAPHGNARSSYLHKR